MSRLIVEACHTFGSDGVLVCSFTKAAARELVSRNLPLDSRRVGTLHSICYRLLGNPRLITEKANLEQWNAKNPAYCMSGGVNTQSALDDPYSMAELNAKGEGEGDELLQELNRLRGLMVPKESWPESVAFFAEAWETFKADSFMIDFTDMIALCVEQQLPVMEGTRALFLDEVQDFSPLELQLARQWGEQCDVLYMAGDDDQCQPGHALVSTTNRGAVPIADLNEHDLLRTFDRTGGSTFYGSKRKGYRFQKACRQYVGELHAFVLASGHSIEVTHNHHMMARWNARAVNAYCVYLMRKGRNWRVGTSQVVRGISGIFGPSGRARSEMADDLWILKIFDSSSMAVLEEDFIAAKYGVSRLVFEWQKSIRHSREALDAHHDRMCAIGQIARLLLDYGKYLDLPYWSRANRYKGRGCKAWQIIPAANCFATYMDMLTDAGKAVGVPSAIAEVKTSRVDIPVYSLNVEPYHTYVSGGIATHNCLYRFKGATPDAFLNPIIPDDQVIILDQSYRVPRKVHALACELSANIATRKEKLYKPRDFEGVVEQMEDVTYQYVLPLADRLDSWVKAGKTVAVLASCGYMLDPTKKLLREMGLPFHNPYRRHRGDWNPLAGREGAVSASQRVLAFLKVSRGLGWWTYPDLWLWASELGAKSIFAHGAKTEIRRAAEKEDLQQTPVAESDMTKWITDPDAPAAAMRGDMEWLQERLLEQSAKSMRFACEIVKSYGPDALETAPKVILGTIHSVKGGEADIVVMFPDLSRSGYDQFTDESDQDSVDAIWRMFYVGATRAKEELYITDAASVLAAPVFR